MAKAIEVEVLAAAVAAAEEAAPAVVAPAATPPVATSNISGCGPRGSVGAASAAVAVSAGLNAAIVEKFGKARAARMATDRTAVSPGDGTLAVYQGDAEALEMPLIGSRRGAEGSPAREVCIRPGRGGRGWATGGHKASRILQEPDLDGDDQEPYSPMEGLNRQSQSSLGGHMGEMGLD